MAEQLISTAQAQGGNGNEDAAIRELVEEMREIDQQIAQFASTLGSWQTAATSAGEIARGVVRADVSREAVVRKARRFARYDPISARTVQLHRIFVLGRGLTFSATEEKTQAVIDAFLDDPLNRSMFSYEGMKRSVDDYYIDGERATVIFPGQGKVKVRRLDPLEIKDIVTNPEDAGEVLGYRREFTGPTGNVANYFYWDFLIPKARRNKKDKAIPGGSVTQDGVIRFSPYGTRGWPVLTPSIDWSNAHLEFMRARTALTAALAKFAWKKKIQGGAKAVAAFQSTFESGFVHSDTEDKPGPAAGSIYVENQSGDLQPIKTDTGAGNARTDQQVLLQQAVMGSGWAAPHYYGDDQSRFATSKEMELAIMKQVECGQRTEADFYSELIKVALEEAGVRSKEQQKFTIDFPEIVRKDVPAIMDAAQKASDILSDLPETKAFQKMILSTLGIEDVSEALDELEGLAEAKANRPPEPTPPPLPAPSPVIRDEESPEMAGAFAGAAHALGKLRRQIEAM